MSFTEHDVSRDRAAAEEMVKLTGQMGVPVIVIDGQPVIGFDRPRLQQLLANGNGRKRPRLGMKVNDADRAARRPDEPPLFGAIVGSVSPSSASERAGIKTGDIVTSINHKRINNVAELEKVIATLASGTHVPVTFYRGEQVIESEIIL